MIARCVLNGKRSYKPSVRECRSSSCLRSLNDCPARSSESGRSSENATRRSSGVELSVICIMQKLADSICLDSRRRTSEVFGSRERTKGASLRILLRASKPLEGICKPASITTLSHVDEVVSGARRSIGYLRTRKAVFVGLMPACFVFVTFPESESESTSSMESRGEIDEV